MTAIAVTQPVDMPAGLRAGGRLSSEVGPSSSGVEHGSAPVGSLSEALHSLKLTSPPAEAALIDRVLAVLKDVVSGPSMLTSFGTGQEARWWDCFAEVYQRELEAQQQRSKREPTAMCKRQVLADILVWAEVTQDHYDYNTLQFVTGPHMGDESFQRIGKMLAEVKAAKGLASDSRASASSPGSEANDKC